MLRDRGLLAAILLGASLGSGVVLLGAGLIGTRPDATRPPGRWHRALAQVRSRGFPQRAGLALVAGVLALVLTRWPVAAVAAGSLILTWPYLFGGARAEQVAIDRLEALVIWTESLRDIIAANVSLEQAIPVSTKQAPPAISPALGRLAGQIHAHTPLENALRDLAADLDDPGADLVVAALIMNVRQRGDNLAQVLSGLCTTARKQLDLRRRILAGRAGLRRGVQIVIALTLAMAGFLIAFGGAYLDPYGSAGGQVALAVVAGMFATGFVWMRRLALGPPARAFLARPGVPADPADLRIVAAVVGLPATAHSDAGGPGFRPTGPRSGWTELR